MGGKILFIQIRMLRVRKENIVGKIIRAEDLPLLTEEQIKAETERARSMPIAYDEDCPPLTEEQLAIASKWEKEKREGTIIQKYGKIIYWDVHEDVFKVEMPELSSCKAQGKTIEEAMLNADSAVEEWLKNLKESGWPVLPPIGRNFVRHIEKG